MTRTARHGVLRVATRADVAAIQRVRHAVHENRLVSGPIADELVVDHLERHGRGWVIEHRGEVVAFAIADRRDGSVWALFVDPRHEGRGCGRRLHDVLVGWLRAQGCGRLRLSTDPGTRAEAFYRRAGWRVSGPAERGEVALELPADPGPGGPG